MEWGNSIFTILPIPDDVSSHLTSKRIKRVEVEINDVPLNLALTKAPVFDQTFVYTGKAVLKDIGIEPGELLDIRLRGADPDHVEESNEVLAALRSAECLNLWHSLTPGKKRGYLHQINSAKRTATRTNRIAKLIVELREL